MHRIALGHEVSRISPIRFQRLMSTFTLDRNVFTPTLYKQVTDLWLAGVDLNGKELDNDAAMRWFRGNPELDGSCRDYFGHALETIGPEKSPNATADPFVEELRLTAEQNQGGDGSQTAWAALGMMLLLDQMPRNIFRTTAGLAKVYTHYDKLAYALVRALLSPSSPIPRPDLHSQWCNSVAHRMWFYVPLEHSEEIEPHNILNDILAQCSKDIEKLQGYAATKRLLKGFKEAEETHRGILDRFGRYPHRNGAMGRQSTQEEEEFLKGGGATFGVTQ